MRTEENGQSSQLHTFWECYDELIAEKNSRNDNTTNKKNMTTIALDIYLKIKMYSTPIKSLYLVGCEQKLISSFTFKISFKIFIRTCQ